MSVRRSWCSCGAARRILRSARAPDSARKWRGARGWRCDGIAIMIGVWPVGGRARALRRLRTTRRVTPAPRALDVADSRDRHHRSSRSRSGRRPSCAFLANSILLRDVTGYTPSTPPVRQRSSGRARGPSRQGRGVCNLNRRCSPPYRPPSRSTRSLCHRVHRCESSSSTQRASDQPAYRRVVDMRVLGRAWAAVTGYLEGQDRLRRAQVLPSPYE